jgi:hypothetical protein
MRVTRVIARQHAEQQRDIAHVAPNRAYMSQRRIGGDRKHRHATELRFDAEQAGHRCRNPDRPSAVGSQCDGGHARCDAGRRAGARAARSLGQVPWVARTAGQGRVPHGFAAELAGGGLADDYRAGAAQALDGNRIGRRDVVRHAARSKSQRCTADRDQILHRDRHAEQRSRCLALAQLRFGALCVIQGLVGENRHEGAKARLGRFQPCQARFDGFHRGQVARDDRPRQVAGGSKELRHAPNIRGRGRRRDASGNPNY